MSKTLRQLLAEHIEDLRALNYSPATLRQIHYVGISFIESLEAGAVWEAGTIRVRHIHAWQRKLAARLTSRGKPLAPRSLAKHADVVRGLLGFLATRGLVQPALVAAVRNIRQPQLLPGSVLSHAQMRTLLDSVPTDTPQGHRTRTMLEMLYSSGIRVAELLGLDIERVDFQGHTALVMGKGRKERVVPIGRTALRFMETYLRAVRPFLAQDPEQRALFVDDSGNRMQYQNFRRIVRHWAAKADLGVNVTPHTFRRSCTTELLRADANMYHVKELLGHESLETLKHYAKLTIVDLKRTHAKCHPRERDGGR
jgi:site-specific recombinase XerD